MDKKPKVLVVEDSKDIRDIICLALAMIGIETIEAHHAQDGFQTLEQTPDIDLITTDMEMVGGHGHDLVSAVRADEHYDRIPVLIVSGNHGDAEEGLSLGANAALGKPFSIEELQTAVQNLLAKAKANATAPVSHA